MRVIKSILIISSLLISSFFIIQKVEAIQGEADVYIIQLGDVPVQDSWIDDPSRVKDGALEACMIKGSDIQYNLPYAHPKRNVDDPPYVDYPPYYDATPLVVTNWAQYQSIIESYRGVIVVNTHGQYLPVPSGYDKIAWVDKIAEAMLNRRLTWVHVGGYTFYRVWYQQGASEEWGEAGFQHFMGHINKGAVDLWPPVGSETEKSEFQPLQMDTGITYWTWLKGTEDHSITDFARSDIGRPLKQDDFKDYVILSLFKHQEYLTGAVIAFAKAGARFGNTSEGLGAYVHIGARYLYGPTDTPWNDYHDYGRGFIGTAAALLVESMGFKPSYDDAVEGGMYGLESRKAGMKVQPCISGDRLDRTSNTRYVRLEFAIYGLLQGDERDTTFSVHHMRFSTSALSGTWSDVQAKVQLHLSKEASGDALNLQGLSSENETDQIVGTTSSAIRWYVGKLAGEAQQDVLGNILFFIGGFKLFGAWLQQGATLPLKGVYGFDPYVDFCFEPRQHLTTTGGQDVRECCSIITVELQVPESNKPPGWMIMPFTYEIIMTTEAQACQLNVTDTLELAMYFGTPGQNDAGTGADAGDSYDSATIAIHDTMDTHGYLGGDDNEDWYAFYAPQLYTIRIYVAPPPYVNFDLELYSPSNSSTPKANSSLGEGQTESISYTSISTGFWKARIYRVQGSGVYSFKLYVIEPPYTPIYPPHPGGGGVCPFVCVWNGSNYVLDNNILPASELSNGADVKDYYRMEQTPVSKNGKYSLLLNEFEHEHSYIDQMKLLAVDHDSDVKIALDPNGQILTYKNPYVPMSAVDNHGNNRLNEIRRMDGDVSNPATFFYGNASDYLVLDFGRVNSDNAKLILRDDMKCCEVCIDVQVLNNMGQWQTVTTVNPRSYWAIEGVNLSPYVIKNQDFKVRLLWTSPHRLDYVGLDTTKQADYEVHTANLVSAVHSTQGDVKALLMESDDIYAELVPGQQIQLEFTLPHNAEEARTYILYSEGHYYTIQ